MIVLRVCSAYWFHNFFLYFCLLVLAFSINSPVIFFLTQSAAAFSFVFFFISLLWSSNLFNSLFHLNMHFRFLFCISLVLSSVSPFSISLLTLLTFCCLQTNLFLTHHLVSPYLSFFLPLFLSSSQQWKLLTVSGGCIWPLLALVLSPLFWIRFC